MKITEADVLERAADILETEGWTQGAYEQPSRWASGNPNPVGFTYCAVGAIRKAHRDLCEENGKKYRRYKRSIELVSCSIDTDDLLRCGNPQECVEAWNDHWSTRADTVIDKLKHVAKEFRNGEVE
jgi:hypothetical protein